LSESVILPELYSSSVVFCTSSGDIAVKSYDPLFCEEGAAELGAIDSDKFGVLFAEMPLRAENVDKNV